MTRKKYRTGFFVQPPKGFHPKPPYKGKAWIAHLEKPSDADDEKTMEVVIEASSRLSAQKALDLMVHCRQIYNGQPINILIGDIELIAYDENYLKQIEEDIFLPRPKSEKNEAGSNLNGCIFASKASHRKKYIYAINKNSLSVSLCHAFLTDLEPYVSDYMPISPFPEDHVSFLYAIVIANSGIEDLGLEIRASSKKPSIIKGQWNPLVLDELKIRLTKANVDLNKTILWTIRGPSTRIRNRRLPRLDTLAPWAGFNTGDGEMYIWDAIAYADWLRDKVAAHKINELGQSISKYDVISVQSLLRRLVLEATGMMKILEMEIEHARWL